MHTYSVNIARRDPTGTQYASYTHWGRIALNDSDNESEARSKFDRIIAAFPAPHWSCTLTQHPLPSGRELDRT